VADVEHLTELFAPLKGVTFKRMFSGYGIMKDAMMFALISRDELYFKADDDLAARFRAEGSRPWTPTMRGKVMTMPYWLVPERLFDEPDEFAAWARDAFDATRRLKAEKKPGRARQPKVAQPQKPSVARLAPQPTKAKKPAAVAKKAPRGSSKPPAKARAKSASR
jgi:DNA transformation protein